MIDTRAIVSRLHALESLAIIPRVSSTNQIARRVLDECIENDLLLPKAIIVAGEQFAGRGRNQRSWSSPPGKGIYATILLTRPASELAVLPLEIANAIASWLREAFGIGALIKWPNDIVVNGRKIAGILIEARLQDKRAYVAIGIGINVEPFQSDQRPNAISIAEANPRGYHGIEAATIAFIEAIDRSLSFPRERHQILEEWRAMSSHHDGDSITCVLSDRTVSGKWRGIDEHGRALLQNDRETIAVSAGDIITS
ncbi:MAG: biotin--[acetyl-CoA-carboxylase] ligase [Thermoanaerobaculia bacterium]